MNTPSTVDGGICVYWTTTVRELCPLNICDTLRLALALATATDRPLLIVGALDSVTAVSERWPVANVSTSMVNERGADDNDDATVMLLADHAIDGIIPVARGTRGRVVHRHQPDSGSRAC